MGEEVSKSRVGSVCSNCHAKLPTELTQIDERGESSIFCPYCGTQITFQMEFAKDHADKNDSENNVKVKRKRDKQLFLSNKEIHHALRLFIYRNIYQIIKSKKTTLRRLSISSDLSSSQIAHLSLKLRRTLLNTSNPIKINTYTSSDPSVRKIERNLKTLKKLIGKEKGFRDHYSHLFSQKIEFIYNLIRGDYNFEDLSEIKRKIVLDLKELFGFKEESTFENSAVLHLSFYLATKIYAILKQKLETQLAKGVIDDITTTITETLITKDFHKDFFNLFQCSLKSKLTRFLSQFQSNVKYDWIYRTSVQDHIFKLTYLVNRLYLEKDAWTNLSGFEKLIADSLKENSLFQDNLESSAHFELNFTLILCRIIYKMMQDSPTFPKTISKTPVLNPSLKQEIIEYISNEIAARKKINFEFLEKFYKLSLEEFQTTYEKVQSNLTSDMILFHSFQHYLEKLVKIVYVITHSVRKKSGLSITEKVIIKDLANYTFRWNPVRGGKYYFYSDREKMGALNEDTERTEFQDIFTRKIADNDPLWRVRAYIMGFLFADGSIFIYKKTNSHQIYASQHKRDKDILEIVQSAIGGNITGPNSKLRYRLEFTNKELFYKLKDFGMRERHTHANVALKILPPEFIRMKIDGISLVRDFVRGFHDGDGSFNGNYKDSSLRFQILGPKNFLFALKKQIISENEDLSCFIAPRSEKIYKTGDKEYHVYSRLRIYIKGRGYKKLTQKDLNKGIIYRRKHPWLSCLHVAGAFNCIKFFNWLYCNNDDFESIKINCIPISGKRKFRKALEALGNSELRKSKLAPDWKDALYDVVTNLKSRFYKSDELLSLTNTMLAKKLRDLALEKRYTKKRISDLDNFTFRLKQLEYCENLIGHYRRRESRVYRNYYYSLKNPPKEVPHDFQRYIDLINKDNSLKKNIKNYVVSIFINDNKWKTYKDIISQISQSKKFSKYVAPIRVKLYLMELVSFEILLIADENNSSNPRFKLNYPVLPKYYNLDLIQIKSLLNNFRKK